MKKKENNKLPLILMVAALAVVLVVVLVIGLSGKEDNNSTAGKLPPETFGDSEAGSNSQRPNNSEGLGGTENTGSSENAGNSEGTGNSNGTGNSSDLDDYIGSNNNWNNNGSSNDEVEKWQEGTITHNGKKYIYNQKIKTYLLMGIDINGKVETAKDYQSGGQSDAMFLLVTNAADKTMSVISINRNTMTRVAGYYKDGSSAGYVNAQICVQHGFGDGRQLSCTRAVDAVSYLFNNLPITGYLSLRMGALPVINDSVGGVTVTVLNDLQYDNVVLKKGETKKLQGMEAYWYLRGRSLTLQGATERLRRQEQYINAYSAQLKAYTNGDVSKMVSIYDAIDDYIVTNIDFAKLAEEISQYTYDSSRMYTVPGETVMGKKFAEYHVDEKKLYNLIIDIFYKEV